MRDLKKFRSSLAMPFVAVNLKEEETRALEDGVGEEDPRRRGFGQNNVVRGGPVVPDAHSVENDRRRRRRRRSD